MIKNIFVAAAVSLVSFSLAGCDDIQPTADQVQRQQQEQLSSRGNMAVGMPSVTHFFEKKNFKRIIELRDDPNLVTYTYTRDFNGHLHLVCQSIGFPIPGATQFTNPSKIEWSYQYSHGDAVVLPQADPNGLYSPANEDATWVLCQNPKNSKEIAPVYQENKVETFLWPMETNKD